MLGSSTLFNRVSERFPYFKLYDVRITGPRSIQATVLPEQISVEDACHGTGGLSTAEACRHLAIAGCLACALVNPASSRHHYLAIDGDFIGSTPDRHRFLKRECLVTATCEFFDAAKARARASIECNGCILTCNYLVKPNPNSTSYVAIPTRPTAGLRHPSDFNADEYHYVYPVDLQWLPDPETAGLKAEWLDARFPGHFPNEEAFAIAAFLPAAYVGLVKLLHSPASRTISLTFTARRLVPASRSSVVKVYQVPITSYTGPLPVDCPAGAVCFRFELHALSTEASNPTLKPPTKPDVIFVVVVVPHFDDHSSL